eukprot:3325609-Rhodomonas_salina.2
MSCIATCFAVPGYPMYPAGLSLRGGHPKLRESWDNQDESPGAQPQRMLRSPRARPPSSPHHNCGATPHKPPPAAPSTKSESSSPRLNGGRSTAGFSLFRDAPAPTILRRADMRRRRSHTAPPRTPAEQRARGGGRS